MFFSVTTFLISVVSYFLKPLEKLATISDNWCFQSWNKLETASNVKLRFSKKRVEIVAVVRYKKFVKSSSK